MAKLGIWRLMAERQNRALLHCRGKQDDDSAEMLVETRKKDLHPPRSDLLSLAGSLSQVNDTLLMSKVKTKTASDKKVSFSDVQVRTYELILGDNPDCSFPLSLGWKYNTADRVDVNTYEDERQPKRASSPRVASIEPDLNTIHIGQVLDPLFLTTNTRIRDNAVDYASSTMVPLTLQERRLRLRAQGHSEQRLRQQERKRRVQLALEWSSGQFPNEEGGFPYNTCAYFRHYIL
jgi:hypothetical protein